MKELIIQKEWRGPTWFVRQEREVIYLPHVENLRKGPCTGHEWKELDGDEASCVKCGVTGDFGHIRINGFCTTNESPLSKQSLDLAEITDGKLTGDATWTRWNNGVR